MFSLLLAATTPAVETAHDAVDAHAAHADAGLVHELVTKFGIDGVNVGMQLFSFAILAVVLYVFAIKPVLATMDQRNSKLAEGLKNAEATAARLEQAQKEATALVQQARLDADKVITDARQLSKELAERETAAATERANALITKAEASIALEHKKMLDEARVEIARLVVATTRQVLSKELSDEERSRYNAAAARELTTV